MGEVIMFPGAEQVSNKADKITPEMERQMEKLQAAREYLNSLNEDEALKTREENTDGFVMPIDLERVDLSEAKGINENIVNKVILDILAEGQDAPERRAIANYLDLKDAARIAPRLTKLSIFNEEEDAELVKQQWKMLGDIRARKVEILSAMIPEETRVKIEALTELINKSWEGRWLEERIKEQEKAVNVKGAPEGAEGYLKKLERIGGVIVDDQEPGTIAISMVRDTKETQNALKDIDDARNLYKPGNYIWNSAMATEEFRREWIKKQMTASDIEFLQRKIREGLARQNIKLVRE